MLADEYTRQLAWRRWERVFDRLRIEGRKVVDIGCGVGDVSAKLAARGADVLAIDANDELLAMARARHTHTATFAREDLQTFSPPDPFDGLWCSFTAAYFPNLRDALARWAHALRPGGWIALTEIDDLFGHHPLSNRARAILSAFTDQPSARGHYDFFMGRKLAQHARDAGFVVAHELSIEDDELAFAGPATAEVIDAWRARFARLPALRAFADADFDALRDEFLVCLADPHHHSDARVVVVIATRP